MLDLIKVLFMELPDIQPYAYTSLLVYIDKFIPSTLKRVLKLSTSSVTICTLSGNLKQSPGINTVAISSDPSHGTKGHSIVIFCYMEKHG